MSQLYQVDVTGRRTSTPSIFIDAVKNGNSFAQKTVALIIDFGPDIDISELKTIQTAFPDNYSTMTVIPVGLTGTEKMDNMKDMFYECQALEYIDLSNFDTSNVIRMDTMFRNCYNLKTLDVSNFDTSNVLNMTYMFNACTSLETIDISNFNMSNVGSVDSMFGDCYSLKNIDLSALDVSNISNFNSMFINCTSLETIDISNFNFKGEHLQVTTNNMFLGCSSLKSINMDGVDTSRVITMRSMFHGCSSLETINGVIDMSSVGTYASQGMFSQCQKLTGVRIKNPPADFDSVSGLSTSQYTIVS